MSDFDDLRDGRDSRDDGSNGDGDRDPDTIAASISVADREPDLDLAASVAGDSVAGTTAATAPVNPRKRKKSSRASVSSHFCLPLLSRILYTPPSHRTAVACASHETGSRPTRQRLSSTAFPLCPFMLRVNTAPSCDADSNTGATSVM